MQGSTPWGSGLAPGSELPAKLSKCSPSLCCLQSTPRTAWTWSLSSVWSHRGWPLAPISHFHVACAMSLSQTGTNSKSPMPCPFCSCLSLSCIYDHWNSPMKTTAISSLCSQSLLSPSLWGVRIHLLGREAIRSLGPDQNHLEQGHCLGYVVCKSITSPTSSSASWMDLGTMPQVSCMTPWM